MSCISGRDSARALVIGTATVLVLAALADAAVSPVANCPLDELVEPATAGVTILANGVSIPIYAVHANGNRYCWLKADEPVNLELTFSRPRSTLPFLHKPLSPVTPVTTDGGTRWTVKVNPGDFVVTDLSPRLLIFVDRISDQTIDPTASTVINVVSQGADNTGATLASPVIQAALDEASQSAAKNTVYVPAGIYDCGTVFMRSNVTLYLEEGAVLRATKSGASAWQWEHDPARTGDKDFSSSAVLFFKTIGTDTLRNARLAGRGSIDGSADYYRRNTTEDPCNLPYCYDNDETHFAKGIMFHAAVGCVADGIMLRNTVFWTMQILGGSHNIVRNFKVINNNRVNNDGINFDNTSHSRVDNTFVISADDGMCWKSTHMFGCHSPNVRDSVTNCLLMAPGYPTFKFGWALHENYYGHVENVYANEYMKWEATKKFWDGTTDVYVSDFTFKNLVVKGGFECNPTNKNPLFHITNNSFTDCEFGGDIRLFNVTGMTFTNTKCNGRYLQSDGDLGMPPVNTTGLVYIVNDPSLPKAPTVDATALNDSEIRLTWNAQTVTGDAVVGYNIYRDGALVTTSAATTAIDSGLAALTTYSYRVSAVTAGKVEGLLSAAVSATTLEDKTPPRVASVSTRGLTTTVQVTFNEPVEKSSAELVSNYGITPAISVTGAVLVGDRAVTLTVSPLSEGVDYTLTVSGVHDRAPASNTIVANTEVGFAHSALVQGLVYEYFEGSWSTMPEFDALTLLGSGILSLPVLDSAKRTDQFAFRFIGFIEIPTNGEYTFYTRSDDGSILFVDDSLIIDNDGLHGAREIGGTITLPAGFHSVSLGFFEATGGQSLTVSWEGPGITKQEIPASAYWCSPETVRVPTQAGVSVVAGSPDVVSLRRAGNALLFGIPAGGARQVSLVVYDMRGSVVSVLAQGAMPPGQYRIALPDGAGSNRIPNGHYVCRLRVGRQEKAAALSILR